LLIIMISFYYSPSRDDRIVLNGLIEHLIYMKLVSMSVGNCSFFRGIKASCSYC